MNINEFCERLGISRSEHLDLYFDEGMRLYSEHGNFAVDKDRILRLNEKYNFIRKYREEILLGCDEIAADEALLVFVYVLVAIYKAGKTPTYSENGVSITILDMPNRERLDTDIAPLYASYFFLEDMIEEYERRGFPYEVISDTLQAMEYEMNDYVGIIGRVGMRRYVGWYANWVKKILISIGRFQFRIAPLSNSIRAYRRGSDVKILLDGVMVHKKGMLFGSAGMKDEEGKFFAEIREENGAVIGYAANEWGECDPKPVRLEGYTEILRKGDMVIDVHIPSKLPLNPEICEKSYNDAIKILSRGYPEHNFKAIACSSWMLEKRIVQILGKQTNLTKFMDAYVGFPTKSEGKAIFGFVFNLNAPVPVEELAEDTSLRRAIKQHMLAGGYVYEKGGIIPLDNCDEIKLT